MTALLPPALAERIWRAPSRWVVTGVAGFIGSNLLEALLRAGQSVVGIDNFSTGHRRNLDEVRTLVGDRGWARFRFVEGDVCDERVCADLCAGADYVLHQAALGSVPRSIENPLCSFDSNVHGFMRMLDAARLAGVKRFVYASSSSVYGDSPVLPKVEDQVGRPLSPYAATKAANELFADVYARTYGMSCVGLRYFNVFGPRQDPEGAYAAVIPRWVAAMLSGQTVWINGDGTTSRDFCFVGNAVQANVRAALGTEVTAAIEEPVDSHRVFNVAVGERSSLNELVEAIRERLARRGALTGVIDIRRRDFRVGDVKHSLADVSAARTELQYEPTHRIGEGLDEALDWYMKLVRKGRLIGP